MLADNNISLIWVAKFAWIDVWAIVCDTRIVEIPLDWRMFKSNDKHALSHCAIARSTLVHIEMGENQETKNHTKSAYVVITQ